MLIPRTHLELAVLLWTAFVAGCDSADSQSVEFVRQSEERQAQQNRQLADEHQQVTEAAKQLVAADAKARQEMVEAQSALQTQLHEERTSLDRQHESLENERRQLADARQREPVLANAIVTVGLLLACLLPIVLCLALISSLYKEPADKELGDLLVLELTAEHSMLLDRPILPDLSPGDPSRRALPPGTDSGSLP